MVLKVVESVYATRATREEALELANRKNRRLSEPDCSFGVVHFREWQGAPIRTVNPWLVIVRKLKRSP